MSTKALIELFLIWVILISAAFLACEVSSAPVKCHDKDSDDTLSLKISEPNISRDANGVTYIWDIECCDANGACADEWSRHKGDINGDGCVDFKDLVIVADHWLEGTKCLGQ